MNLDIPQVVSRCNTCMSHNATPMECPHCGKPNMCSNCSFAGICKECRDSVQKGEMKIERKASEDEKYKTFAEVAPLLKQLQTMNPKLVPQLKILTKLSPEQFDELMRGL